MLQKLPIGIQSFPDLRNNDYLYVDKTEDIYRMVTSGKPYFLSRPRRFGKSLLVSTLEALFQGKQELFQGLFIYDKWDWTKQHPVMRIDFGGHASRSSDELKTSLDWLIKSTADKYQISLTANTLPDKFGELIANLHQLSGEQLVVLIDEYDKPIIDNLNDLRVADENRIVLHDFYQVLKASDDHLRFIFLTGVSKFSKISVFSGLNSLNDITIDPQYVSICGYTQAELESNFDPYIENLSQYEGVSKQEAIDAIKRWYDGYSWNGRTFVYNPFSTLQLFTKNQFMDYWFASGSPTFLVNLIKERNDVDILMKPFEMPVDGFNAFDIHSLDTRLLLFQTGYLTIKKMQKDFFGNGLICTLGVPNEEVCKALTEYILGSFVNQQPSAISIASSRMMEQLFAGDSSALERNLQELFSRIPYQLHIPRENYYHSLFLLWLNLLGFKVDAEVSTDKGRIDAVWAWMERVVIVEVKYAATGKTRLLLDEALLQIRERRYYQRYAGENKRIALLAVACAGKEIACRMEEIVA